MSHYEGMMTRRRVLGRIVDWDVTLREAFSKSEEWRGRRAGEINGRCEVVGVSDAKAAAHELALIVDAERDASE